MKKYFNVFKLSIPEFLVDSKVFEPHLTACLAYTNIPNVIILEIIVPAEHADYPSQGIAQDYHSGDLKRKPIWGLSQADVVGDDSELRSCNGVTLSECNCQSCKEVMSAGEKKLIKVTVTCEGAPLTLEAYHFDAEEDGSMISVLVSVLAPSFKKCDIKCDPAVEYPFTKPMGLSQRNDKKASLLMRNPANVGAGSSKQSEPITLSSDEDNSEDSDRRVHRQSGSRRSPTRGSPVATKRKHLELASTASAPEADDFTAQCCASVLHLTQQPDVHEQQRSTTEGASIGSAKASGSANADGSQARVNRQYTFARAMQDHVTLLEWLDLHRFAMQRLEELQRVRSVTSNESSTSRPIDM